MKRQQFFYTGLDIWITLTQAVILTNQCDAFSLEDRNTDR